jgi:hypothetical protein
MSVGDAVQSYVTLVTNDDYTLGARALVMCGSQALLTVLTVADFDGLEPMGCRFQSLNLFTDRYLIYNKIKVIYYSCKRTPTPMEEKILSLHPQHKIGASIGKTKYEVVKQAIMTALAERVLTFDELSLSWFRLSS